MKICHQKFKNSFLEKCLKDNKAGFTLIELLVVIALVGVFASTVLASVNEIRLSAESTSKNLVVREYINALEQVYSSHGTYPVNDQVGGPTPACLGETADGYCGLTTGSTVQPSVNNMIRPFYSQIPNFNPVTGSLFGSPYSFRGPIYSCANISCSNNSCKGYRILWMQKGSNQPCLPSANGSNGAQYGGNTYCLYEFNHSISCF